MFRLHLGIVLSVVVLCGGCGHAGSESGAAASSDDVVLFSISPQRARGDGASATFHGYPILGRMTVEGDDRKALLKALARGREDAPDVGARCFSPRHGLGITEDGGRLEYLICFQCFWMHTFQGSRRTATATIAKSPRDTFNRILREAGIPLAK